MKKSLLFVCLGLGLLLVKAEASASDCCHIKSQVPWKTFFFDKLNRPIGSLPANGPQPITISEDSFPVFVSKHQAFSNEAYRINVPNCYTLKSEGNVYYLSYPFCDEGNKKKSTSHK